MSTYLKGVIQSINTVNLLAAITPTNSGWNTVPGTDANITDELVTTLTTSGIQTNNTDSTLKYDLGITKRVIVTLIRGSVGTAAGVRIEASNDDITYYPFAQTPPGGNTATQNCSGEGKARFIQAVFLKTATGNTIANMGIRAYLL